MACKKYQTALTEAAASGEAPIGDLQIHLRGCSVCDSAFTEAKRLFSAIDKRIGASVNEEPSANFLATLRANVFVERAESSGRSFRWSWRLAALASAASVIAIVTIVVHGERQEVASIPRTAIERQVPAPTLSVRAASTGNHREGGKRKQRQKMAKPATPVVAEQEDVIFPPEEQKNYRALIATLQHRTNRAIVAPATPVSGENLAVEFMPVQIASLEISPLVRGDN